MGSVAKRCAQTKTRTYEAGSWDCAPYASYDPMQE